MLLFKLLQLIKYLLRFVSLSRRRIGISKLSSSHFGVFQLSYGLVIHSLPLISLYEAVVCWNEVWIDLYRLLKLFDCPVMLAQEVEKDRDVPAYVKRQWIKLLGPLQMWHGLIYLP